MFSKTSVDCFLAVARHRNITRAAQALFMSRQAVSKHISRLEQELETNLFARTPGDMTLTPAGDLYRDYFDRAIDEWKKLRMKVKTVTSAENLIRIGLVAGIALEDTLLSLIQPEQELGCRLMLTWEHQDPQELYNSLQNGRLDIVFSYNTPVDDTAVKRVPFMRTNYTLVAGKALPELDRHTTAKDFEKHQFFIYSPTRDEEDRRKNAFIDLCARNGLSVSNILFFRNNESVQTSVEMGEGCTVCSSTSKLCGSPRVKTFPLEMTHLVMLAWRRDEPRQSVGSVVDLLEKGALYATD